MHLVSKSVKLCGESKLDDLYADSRKRASSANLTNSLIEKRPYIVWSIRVRFPCGGTRNNNAPAQLEERLGGREEDLNT